MSNRIKLTTDFISLQVLLACSGSEPDASLVEAASIHNQAIAIQAKVAPMLREMAALQPQLIARRDFLVATDSTRAASMLTGMDSTRTAMNAWEDEIVEVPGNEDHEHHAEGEAEHDHEHAPPDVTPDEMLAIQQEMKKNIVQIQTAANRRLNQAKLVMNAL